MAKTEAWHDNCNGGFERMKLDLSRSWIIGDNQIHDLATRLWHAAGLAGGTLLAAGDSERRKAMALASARFTVATASNLADAIAGLIDQGRLETVG